MLLLQDVFEIIIKACVEFYQPGAARYLIAPSIAWDAMLLYTNVKSELITEEKHDIYTILEDHVRGGLVA